MQQIPNIAQIKKYLKDYNPLDLAGASVNLFSKHNHLNYQLKKNGKIYYLRMTNPETYRTKKWLSMPEEYIILKYLENTELAPRVYYVDPERFDLPLLIGEFVQNAVCFKDIKPLEPQHLAAAAKSIARLNSQNITPENYPFLKTHYSYLANTKKCKEKLNFLKQSKNKSIILWIPKIEKVLSKAEKILAQFEPLLKNAQYAFHFDGAHCGNTYWKDKKVIFFDWQSVSYGDPAFTLARFITSLFDKGEPISDTNKKLMIKTYLSKKKVPHFAQLLEQRIFERQLADMVWIIWHFEKSKKNGNIEKKTNIQTRYQSVLNLIQKYSL